MVANNVNSFQIATDKATFSGNDPLNNYKLFEQDKTDVKNRLKYIVLKEAVGIFNAETFQCNLKESRQGSLKYIFYNVGDC